MTALKNCLVKQPQVGENGESDTNLIAVHYICFHRLKNCEFSRCKSKRFDRITIFLNLKRIHISGTKLWLLGNATYHLLCLIPAIDVDQNNSIGQLITEHILYDNSCPKNNEEVLETFLAGTDIDWKQIAMHSNVRKAWNLKCHLLPKINWPLQGVTFKCKKTSANSFNHLAKNWNIENMYLLVQDLCNFFFRIFSGNQ